MSPPAEIARRSVGAALGFVILAAWITPFQRDLFIGDETKYAQVIREMRATGAFFLPTLNGVPFTHKPPLHFWLIDLLSIPFGLYSMWSFVLPSLIAFLFLLWLMWRIGGPLAAFVCGSSLMIWGSAQTARMDVAFTALIVLGAWMMLRSFEGDDRRAMLLCGIALGVATLVKGPMAPVIGIVLYAIESWRRRRRPHGADFAALAAMIVIPLLWFVPAMMLGGATYTREVIVKQTVGRAVSAWVHSAPPWFYLLHMPAILVPWFFPALAALRRANRFYLSWILAVLVPYSLLSSKLDVYMMALIPPVALMIADFVRRDSGGKIANALALLVLLIVGLAGLFIPAARLKSPEASLLTLSSVRILFVILAACALIALLVTFRSLFASTIAVGIVPIVAMVYVAIALMPLVNDIGSPRRLIDALERQHVAPEDMALYSCPYLWSRDFPRALERVRYVDAKNVGNPMVIATSRVHGGEIAGALRGYQRVEELRMIGKWFDVHRR